MKGWGPDLVKRRPDITMETVDKFLTRMYRTNPDFVFTVTRDFVRNCQTPVLILPDDIPPHPYAVAMEAAHARAEGRSQHLPVEGAQGANSPGGAPDPFLPAGAPPCLDRTAFKKREAYFFPAAASFKAFRCERSPSSS